MEEIRGLIERQLCILTKQHQNLDESASLSQQQVLLLNPLDQKPRQFPKTQMPLDDFQFEYLVDQVLYLILDSPETF